MGLYRTKPEEVEAIQYSGGVKPFGNNPPDWFWMSMSSGRLAIEAGDMYLVDGDQREKMNVGDWLILTNMGALRVSDDETFKNYFVATRRMPKRGKKDSAVAEAGQVQAAA